LSWFFQIFLSFLYSVLRVSPAIDPSQCPSSRRLRPRLWTMGEMEKETKLCCVSGERESRLYFLVCCKKRWPTDVSCNQCLHSMGGSSNSSPLAACYHHLCSTDALIMEPCCVLNVSDTCRTHMSCVFLRICHMSACRVHFNIVMSL